MAKRKAQEKLHPKIKAWVRQHNNEQEEARRGMRAAALVDSSDLTERDLYRFRATSQFLYAVESKGGCDRLGKGHWKTPIPIRTGGI